MIKLVILDVDGVMTDGRKYYDRDGVVRLKTFCDKDWTAIKRFRAIGINVIFLTGDPFNVTIGENRNIDVIVNRGSGNSEIMHKDKSEYLPKICEDYRVSPNEIAFIGDDIFDIQLIPRIVRGNAQILSGSGGENLIAEMYDYMEEKKIIVTGYFPDHLQKVYEIDLKEKF